jgi:hypothetical protein
LEQNKNVTNKKQLLLFVAGSIATRIDPSPRSSTGEHEYYLATADDGLEGVERCSDTTNNK